MSENRRYVTSSGDGARVATDAQRDDVFISGTIANPGSFAAMFRTLGKIAKLDTRRGWVDHSAYQNWVVHQYLKELTDSERRELKNHALLTDRLSKIEQQLASLRERLFALAANLGVDYSQKRRFYEWLYSYDREAWFVLDPLITVTRESIHFECLSSDEAAYARLSMPMSVVATSDAVRPGTTNIDYSLPLDRELARARSYRPLNLTVGSAGLSASTSHSEVIERPIDLPESWIAGFAEVSAATGLSENRITVSARLISNVLAVLSQRKDAGKGRGLIFHLTPGAPIEVELQPWGVRIQDHEFTYQGPSSTSIIMYGRRRLMVLRDLLPQLETLEVALLGNAMPTYWTARNGDFALTLGFSGWNRLDWSSKTRISALAPKFDLNTVEAQLVIDTFISLRSATLAQLMEYSGTSLTEDELKLLMRTLLFRGRALYEMDSGRYVFREIAPGVEVQRRATYEERLAESLIAQQLIAVRSDTSTGDSRVVVGVVKDSQRAKPTLTYDESNQIAEMTCGCPEFNLRQHGNAPCRHIIALDRLVVATHV